MSEPLQLDLKKPLDKMTAKELREFAMKNLPQIVGVSGMEKEEILKEIKEALGITEDADGKVANPYKGQILAIKAKIRELRVKKSEMQDASRKEIERVRRKINKLKKRTRRLAAAV